MGDTIRESFLRKTPEAERQGRNRMERGRSFWLYIHQLAASRGWECHWRKIEECGIGHEAVPMGKQAVPLLTTDSLRVLFIGNSYTFLIVCHGKSIVSILMWKKYQCARLLTLVGT